MIRAFLRTLSAWDASRRCCLFSPDTGNSPGRALLVRSAAPIHFDAHHYSVADCQRARHDHELPRRPETVLHLDAAHAPIGGEMAWSTKMPEPLALRGGTYHLSVEISLA